jgi:hypothetical protein
MNIIWKYALLNELGETISRHKSMEKANTAKLYCKTCKTPVIVEI